MSSHTYPAVLKQADNEVAYPGADPGQTAEWLEALDQVIHADGPQEASQLLQPRLVLPHRSNTIRRISIRSRPIRRWLFRGIGRLNSVLRA